MTTLISTQDLSVSYRGHGAEVRALRGVTFRAEAGEVVGIVGESGCGKSTLASAIMTLLPPNAKVTGRLDYRGENVLALSSEQRRALRGRKIAMIFQDPMTAFHPAMTIGRQLVEFQMQMPGSRAEKEERAEAMLAKVGIADSALNMRRYVHELSGGMRQRAAIAAALLMTPDVLLADEPTTALDVTMEAQIIHLLRELRREHQGTIIVITHHLGVIGELCDRVYVMYAGEVVEEGAVDAVYHDARHPYTRALIACDPATAEQGKGPLPTIPGRLPDPSEPIAGCGFASRCSLASERCRVTPPPAVTVAAGHVVRCHEVTP